MSSWDQVLFVLAAQLLTLAVTVRHLCSSGIRKETSWAGWGGAPGGRGFCPLSLGLTPCLPLPVIMVAHFLQSLTHRLVLGGELVYHRRPGEEGAILTLAGKYSGTG